MKRLKSTIGLRGFTLQLKVERANTVADFRELRQPYLEAVLKAKRQRHRARLARSSRSVAIARRRGGTEQTLIDRGPTRPGPSRPGPAPSNRRTMDAKTATHMTA
ncbi:hypothetical protein ACFS07_18645 [Undibacterium arcticum]